jgi:hypothetical protein
MIYILFPGVEKREICGDIPAALCIPNPEIIS